MKIGILTPSIYMYQKRYAGRIFAPGDLARHLVAGLMARGHDVTWCTAPEDTTATLIPGDQALLDNDLKIRVFQDITNQDKNSLYATKMYYETDLLTRAYRTAQKEKFDVMHHFHSFGFLAHFFEELTGVPTLYTLHDPIPTDDMLESWLFKRFPEHRFLSISKSQQGHLASHFFANVYNGIDSTKFPFDPKGGERLVAAGRMVPMKGHDIAIAAARAAGRPLAIATWITDAIRASEYYKGKIEPLIGDKDIEINSMMLEKDLAKFYQNAKALLFPVAWDEPFGLVMVEAMACGTPVIAYNRGSVSEIVRDGVTGFIIDPDDTGDWGNKGNWIIKKTGIEGLVEAIKRISEIDRATCRTHVEEHFTVEKMVEGYEAVYKEVAASRH